MDRQQRFQRSTTKQEGITSAINPEAETSTSKSEPLVPKIHPLEVEIKRNKGRPLLIGRDLQTIRDKRLYSDTWDKYCRHHFHFSGRAGDYYIAAWRKPLTELVRWL